jgi:hypothetical protein
LKSGLTTICARGGVRERVEGAVDRGHQLLREAAVRHRVQGLTLRRRVGLGQGLDLLELAGEEVLILDGGGLDG